MGVGGRRRPERVLVVGRRPVVSVVADDGVGVPRGGDPEVGLAHAAEGGHAGKRTCGNPENWSVVILRPRDTDALLNQRHEKKVTRARFSSWSNLSLYQQVCCGAQDIFQQLVNPSVNDGGTTNGCQVVQARGCSSRKLS